MDSASEVRPLSRTFRKRPIGERQREVAERFGWRSTPDSPELADIMVENAIGYKRIPVGITSDLVVDGVRRVIPLATEEPSVVAAQHYGGVILSAHGGVQTTGAPPIMSAQIFLRGCSVNARRALRANHLRTTAETKRALSNLKKRGGGFIDMQYRWVIQAAPTRLLCVEFWVDVRDALGANILNSVAEMVAERVASRTGGTQVMAIISNAAERRVATATFEMPVSALPARVHTPSQIAAGIVTASDIAHHDPARAVTHNKGIMNGVSAVALATGNDTRALEAAVHAYASRSGQYRGVSHYSLVSDRLCGTLTAPLPVALVGGAVGLQRDSAAALRMLGVETSTELSGVVAAVGLTQNFAALLALVDGGIQRGHMRQHALRVAWRSGARHQELRRVAEELHRNKRYTVEAAREYRRKRG